MPYIGYAIGEVFLIILGILFALKINDWNEDRKAQAEFEEYVLQLREDVKLAISVTENRVDAADRRKREASTVLSLLDAAQFDPTQVETFETALEGLGKYSVRDLNFGHLGRLLEGNLEIIDRNQDLTNLALQMTREVKGIFSMIVENLEFQRLTNETFSKARGMKHATTPEIALRYDLQRLRESDEFIFAAQDMAYFLAVVSDGYARMTDHLITFLAALEDY